MIAATRVTATANQFEVAGNKTGYLLAGMPILVVMGGDGTHRVIVESASYDSGDDITTCTVLESILTDNLTEVQVTRNAAITTGKHDHTDDEQGGAIPAAVLTDEDLDILTQFPQATEEHQLFFLRVAADYEAGFEKFNLIGDPNQFIGTNFEGTDLEQKTLEGTANQVVIDHDDGTGTFTFSLPQDIDESATPIVAGLTITDFSGLLVAVSGTIADFATSTPLAVFRRNAANDDYEWAVPVLGNIGDVDTSGVATGGILFYSTDTFVPLAIGTATHVLQSSGTAPAWVELDGDKIDIDWNPSWSTPVVVTESSDVDDLASHLKGIDNSLEIALFGVADVSVEYVDANELKITAEKSGFLEVNGTLVDLADDQTITTDSSGDYVVAGSTTVSLGSQLSAYTGSDYNNFGIHFLYVANDNAAFSFGGYDRRSKLFVSAVPPTDGYLAASGDGVNARFVGAFCCNSSRQLENAMCVASAYNGNKLVVSVDGSGASWDAITLATPTVITGCEFHAVVLDGQVYSINATGVFQNDDANSADFVLEVKNGASVLKSVLDRAASAAGYASQITRPIEYSDNVTDSSVLVLSLSVTASGADSSPTMRPDYASLEMVRF